MASTATTTPEAKVSSPITVAEDSDHHCNRRRNNTFLSSFLSSCPDCYLVRAEEEQQQQDKEATGDDLDCQQAIIIPMVTMTCTAMMSRCNDSGYLHQHQHNNKRRLRRSTLRSASCWLLFFVSTCGYICQISSSHSRAASSFQDHRHPLSHYHYTHHPPAVSVAATAVESPGTRPERRLVAAAVPTSSNNKALSSTTLNAVELRYLTFGSSVTWGIGLDEPTISAYPYQLSPLVHNAGLKTSSNNSNDNAVLAAACTQSIVQDGVYDVIVLEYSIVNEAVVLLAQRLRQRFPHATIILLRLWSLPEPAAAASSSPLQKATTTSTRQLPAGLDAHVLDLMSLTSSTLLQSTTSSSSSSSSSNPSSSQQGGGAVGGDANTRLLLSAHAHVAVARSIRALVESLHVTRHVDDDDHVLGDWSSGAGFGGDYCNLWYDNGAFLETSSTRRLRPVEFTPPQQQHQQESQQESSSSSWTSLFFQDDEDIHKHALELDISSSNSDSSSIRIQNPFSTPRMLYLSYLTTSTELDDDDATDGTSLIYPHLRVRINGKPSVLLESWHSIKSADAASSRGVEVIRTSAVGVLPGNGVESMIEFHALPGQHAQRPFRLLGASFLPDVIAERLDLEYTLLQAN